jgi:formyltetrahydrofolate-dependent phosphoribosylglycinamide formyltransferase
LKKVRTAIFISGRGSNMSALIEAAKKNEFPSTIDLVLTNEKEAEGLNIAASHQIKTQYVNNQEFESVAHGLLKEEKIELICLAGFMQIIAKDFLQKWKGRIINIHPSYLPSFKGLNAQEQAIKARASFSGCTVHFVNEKIDEGEIILQKKVLIEEKDNTESLSKKILREEHFIYPKALEIVANKILKIKH